jgi:gamma-glutamylcyclotransferase (GGCT)/AIG2-like uncharacterized protein YtfP
MKLFIYGTIKRGQCRADVMTGQKFLGSAKLVPMYKMFNLGQFPALVKMPGLDNGPMIEGELWEVDEDCIRRLDMIEGTPSFYRRQEVQVAGQEVESLYVESYLYQGDISDSEDVGVSWDDSMIRQ